MIRVLEVSGARPNFMKIAPIHRALLSRPSFEPVLVHTGQHYDKEMSQIFFKDLGINDADYSLGVGSGSHAKQTAQVMQAMEPVVLEVRPNIVLVVGDVNSTLGAALTAAKLNVPIAHVEAGLRSFDRSMPEEINRVVTDALSELLLAPSPDAVDNLRQEGIPAEKIHHVGNVMIDSLEALRPKASESPILRTLDLPERGYFLATIHRPNNVDDPSILQSVVEILLDAAIYLPVVLVAHPRTDHRLREYGLFPKPGSLRVVKPVGYMDFLQLMLSARGVLTDSGGIQEETTVLGVPCLTLRRNTERPITVSEGTNRIVGLDRKMIDQALVQIVGSDLDAAPRRPKLWDGRAAERIACTLEERFSITSR